MQATEDIRDIEDGETYFVIADKDRGGRCVMNGMFIGIWRTKADAVTFRDGNTDLIVIKQVKQPNG